MEDGIADGRVTQMFGGESATGPNSDGGKLLKSAQELVVSSLMEHPVASWDLLLGAESVHGSAVSIGMFPVAQPDMLFQAK